MEISLCFVFKNQEPSPETRRLLTLLYIVSQTKFTLSIKMVKNHDFGLVSRRDRSLDPSLVLGSFFFTWFLRRQVFLQSVLKRSSSWQQGNVALFSSTSELALTNPTAPADHITEQKRLISCHPRYFKTSMTKLSGDYVSCLFCCFYVVVFYVGISAVIRCNSAALHCPGWINIDLTSPDVK